MKIAQIRQMQVEDLGQVLLVERNSFPTPWTTDIFYRELFDNRHAYYFVIEIEEEIVGYVGMWIVLEDAQITNIAIAPHVRGQKLGEKLFGYAIQFAIGKGVERMSLEVRKSNLPAQHLYEKFGLVQGGVRKNYYTDNQEDAIVMWVNLT